MCTITMYPPPYSARSTLNCGHFHPRTGHIMISLDGTPTAGARWSIRKPQSFSPEFSLQLGLHNVEWFITCETIYR